MSTTGVYHWCITVRQRGDMKLKFTINTIFSRAGFVDIVIHQLVSGNEVSIPGLGKFYVTEQRFSSSYDNEVTRKVVRFRAYKYLFLALNPDSKKYKKKKKRTETILGIGINEVNY